MLNDWICRLEKMVIKYLLFITIFSACLFTITPKLLGQELVEYQTVRKIIRTLERRYECRFFYEENTLDLDGKIEIDLKKKSLQQALEELSAKLSLDFRINADRLVLLKKKQEAAGILAGVPAVKMSDTAFFRSIELPEVVVVGYGQQVAGDVTGAISVLNRRSVARRQGAKVNELLYEVPGIYVNNGGAQPGIDNASIRIRGLGSFNNNTPLVLVDGMEYKLEDININDIESVSVLKDAASASIYGVKSANGVVLVTTRNAKKHGVQAEYSNTFGWQRVTYLPDAVWDPVVYMEQKNLALGNEGKAPDYSQGQILEYKQGMKTDPYTYPATDWFKLAFRQAFEQEHSLRISVNKKPFSVYASFDYTDREGILIGTGSRKYAFNFKSSFHLHERLEISLDMKGISRTVDEPHTSIYNFMASVTRSLPVYTPWLKDGRYGNSWVKTPGHNVFLHPLAHVNEGLNRALHQRLMFNIGLKYALAEGLSYDLFLGNNRYDMDQKIFHPIVATYNPKTGEVQENKSERQAVAKTFDDKQFSFSQHLNWNRQFDSGHHTGVLLGMSWLANDRSSFWASSEGFLNNKVTNISAGTKNYKNGGSDYQDRLLSFYGRARYDYRETYLFETALRYDGSSRFAPDHRWGVFPSFSVGWRMDKEAFAEGRKWLSLFKWRVSWGLLGNQETEDYQYTNRLTGGSDYNFGDDIALGVAQTSFFNSAITWEKTSSFNAGADIGLWDDRLKLSAEYYRKRTYDILQRLKIPAQAGNWEGAIRNLGVVLNNGYELSVAWREQRGGFTYSLGGSVCYVNNIVSGMNGHEIADGSLIIREGYPIDSYYLLQAEGVFRDQQEVDEHAYQSYNTAVGDLKFKDLDGNGTIDDNDKIVTGKCFPDYTYSFSVAVGYKGFELSTFWQGVQGVNTYPTGNLAMPFYNGAGITREWAEGSWTSENPDASLPRLMTANGGHDNYARASTFWLRDASYLRLKNIQLRYNLPPLFLNKAGIMRVTVFVSGQNLWTISDFNEFDPEKDLKSSSLYEYPSAKGWSVGLNVTF